MRSSTSCAEPPLCLVPPLTWPSSAAIAPAGAVIEASAFLACSKHDSVPNFRLCGVENDVRAFWLVWPERLTRSKLPSVEQPAPAVVLLSGSHDQVMVTSLVGSSLPLRSSIVGGVLPTSVPPTLM